MSENLDNANQENNRKEENDWATLGTIKTPQCFVPEVPPVEITPTPTPDTATKNTGPSVGMVKYHGQTSERAGQPDNGHDARARAGEIMAKLKAEQNQPTSDHRITAIDFENEEPFEEQKPHEEQKDIVLEGMFNREQATDRRLEAAIRKNLPLEEQDAILDKEIALKDSQEELLQDMTSENGTQKSLNEKLSKVSAAYKDASDAFLSAFDKKDVA